MRPFIVIRQFESTDMLSRKELIKQYAMSFAFDAFTSCLFREVYSLITSKILQILEKHFHRIGKILAVHFLV